MEILMECRTLHDELQSLHKELQYISSKIERADIDFDETVKLYEDEFRVAMSIMGCFEDLLMRLDELSREEGMVFIANRIRNNAQTLVLTGGFDVANDV
jgi:hypothetical protein